MTLAPLWHSNSNNSLPCPGAGEGGRTHGGSGTLASGRDIATAPFHAMWPRNGLKQMPYCHPGPDVCVWTAAKGHDLVCDPDEDRG